MSQASAFAERMWSGYETPTGKKIVSADAILRLLPWRERMVLRGTMASPLNQGKIIILLNLKLFKSFLNFIFPLNQGFCTRNPLDCFQPEEI